MTTTAQPSPSHPIVACAEELLASLGSVRDVQPVFMSPADKQAAVVELGRVMAALAELRMRVLATADDLIDQTGARDTGAWLASATQEDVGPARGEARLAEALDRRWPGVATGMADGLVSPAQARAVVTVLDALPADLDPTVVTAAEAQMVEWCEEFKPTHLRTLGRRLLDMVAPEIAEAEDAQRLEREEQQAREKCRLSLRPVGDGSTRLSGLIPDADAARLRTYLDAYTSPRKATDAISGEEDKIPYPRRLGQAFCALLEHLNPKKLPRHGGDATTVMVTITLDSLMTDLATGGLIDADLTYGDNLSATAIRRLACTANIIPVVLGGKGEILDLGRSRRLYSPPQRKALRLQHKVCQAEGCTVPGTRCEAHHDRPWSQGGRTDLADARLYCSFHHHRAHDGRCGHEVLPNGKIRFYRLTRREPEALPEALARRIASQACAALPHVGSGAQAKAPRHGPAQVPGV